MTELTGESPAEIIAEAGGIERFLSPEYQQQAQREYLARKAAHLAAKQETPRQLLRKAIIAIEHKCLPAADVVPELEMLLQVLHFLNQPEVRAIQEAA